MISIRKCYARGAVIRAGGEGARLRSLTHHIMGHALPKQFCPMAIDETLLEQTRSRVALAVSPQSTIIVVTRLLEPHYVHLLNDTHRSRVVAQPRNRETAPAILYALLRVYQALARSGIAPSWKQPAAAPRKHNPLADSAAYYTAGLPVPVPVR
jgi:mannose-1-phosphate guanylyltransferase